MRRTVVGLVSLALAWLAPAWRAEAEETAPADLRVEWVDGGGTVRGAAGETVSVRYVLRNVGGRDAFAAVIRAFTALGPVGQVLRLEPGPAAGGGVDLKLQLPVAAGMREVCVEASLQGRSSTEPADPQQGDNRTCRAVVVAEEAGS